MQVSRTQILREIKVVESNSLELISREIAVTEKSFNFHTTIFDLTQFFCENDRHHEIFLPWKAS